MDCRPAEEKTASDSFFEEKQRGLRFRISGTSPKMTETLSWNWSDNDSSLAGIGRGWR